MNNVRVDVGLFLRAQVDISQLEGRSQALRDIRAELQAAQGNANLAISSRAAHHAQEAAAGTTQLLRRAASVKRRLTALGGKEGIDATVAQLADQLKASASTTKVKGLLLHGMGGIGKSTLAHQLAVALQDQQLYQGGVLRVVLQPQLSPGNPQLPRSDDFLRQAQRDLLQQLTEKEQQLPLSLDEGAGHLRDAFMACSGCVLLLVDNVPEDDSGINDMLPPLDECLATGSRVIFTCRNGWVGGLGCLPPTAVDLHKVEPLPSDVSASILETAAGKRVLLNHQQLTDVLAYCGGLPLALKVIGGFLRDEATRTRVLQSVEDSLNTKLAVGVGNKQNHLVATMRTTVNLLEQELLSNWLDIAMLFSDGSVPWQTLEMVYGQHQMNNLLLRNLISKVNGFVMFKPAEVPQVHHVLLTVANEICQPGTSEYRICDFNWSQVPDPLPAGTQVIKFTQLD
eukprot:gene11224-11373_t